MSGPAQVHAHEPWNKPCDETCPGWREQSTPMYVCQWCAENPVPAPGLCADCQQEPDALEFKAAHDAQCPCMSVRMDPDDAARLRGIQGGAQ